MNEEESNGYRAMLASDNNNEIGSKVCPSLLQEGK
jgi:hypothetical protein